MSLTIEHVDRGANAIDRDAREARAFADRHRHLFRTHGSASSKRYADEFDRIADIHEEIAAKLRALVLHHARA